MNQEDMDKFVTDLEKLPAKEALVKIRKLKFEIGERAFRQLAYNSFIKRKKGTVSRYHHVLMEEEGSLYREFATGKKVEHRRKQNEKD